MHAQQALRSPRFEDFVYVHLLSAQDNVLCWLGNGLTMAQKEDGNTTAYLDQVDVPPFINHGPRRAKKGNDDEGRNKPASSSIPTPSTGHGNEVNVDDILVERSSVAVGL